MSEWLERAKQRQQQAPSVRPPSKAYAPPPPPPPVAVIPPRILSPPPPPPPPQVAPSRWLIAAQEAAAARGADKVMSTADQDLLRILKLPCIPLGTARCPDRPSYAAGFYNHAKPADFSLRDIQIDSVYTYEMFGGLLAPVTVGGGKCLCASAHFLDVATGKRRSVADPGPVAVHAYCAKSARLGIATEAHSFSSGEKECVKVVTASGRDVELSTDHPILTPSGWVHAGALVPGSLVAAPEALRVPQRACQWSEDHVLLMGYLVADGSLSSNQCSFVDDNSATLDHVQVLVSRLGGTSTRVKEDSKAFRVTIRGLRPLVREWGIDDLSKNKQLPDWTWGMPDTLVWKLLGALFTCDGHIEKSAHNIEYSSASELLIRDVHFLLQRMGVHGRVRFKRAKCKGKRYPAWVMAVNGVEAQRLLEGTGPWLGQEEAWRRCMDHHKEVKHNTNVDIVPLSRKEMMEVCDEMGYPKSGGDASLRRGSPRSDLKKRLGVSDGQYIGRAAFASWVAESGYSGKYAWLGKAPLRWDKVTSVIPIGVQPVFDLSVPGPHNFVANGLVVHNTLISILCAKVAIERRGHYRVVIMVPPEVLSQLTVRDLPQMRKWLALDALPIYLVTGSADQRMKTASRPGRAVFIYTYSSLSTQTGFAELAAMSPTCFIQDEAHNIARSTAARTKRWQSAINIIDKAISTQQMGPDVTTKRVEAVLMSGTITKKKIADYAHLAKAALHEMSPTPIKETSILVLGGAIDAEVSGGGLGEVDQERVNALVGWCRQMGHDPAAKVVERGLHPTTQEIVREAYQFRLRTAQGVISTTESGVGCSLIISWSEPPRPRTPEAQRMATLMQDVVEKMITPDGDVIDYGMHQYKWLWELSGGFYNSLVWPTPEQVVKLYTSRRKPNAIVEGEMLTEQGKPITATEAEMLLEQAKTHHALLQVYHKFLRQFLDRNHIPSCDTPMLVGLELTKQLAGEPPRFKLPRELLDSYEQQKAAKYDDLPERIGRSVRVCDYKIVAAVEWAKEHVDTGGFLWVHHPEMARWLHEYLTAAGIKHTLALAGDNEAAFAPGLVVASFAHGTGKNLQHQNHNLFVELRREASQMEQTLGRTHRSGQKADDVRADVFISSGFDLALFNAILRDADYAQATTGQAQRLCYATYSPVIPPTDPRLAMRLGIINRWEDASQRGVKTFDTITPPEALNWSDVFRSTRFVAGQEVSKVPAI